MTLRQLIDSHGISQAFIADKMNITRSGLSYMLAKKLPERREVEIKEILKANALSLLESL